MLGVLVWLVVILLICFSVLGWHWAIIEVILLPLFALFLIIYVDFPENRFDTKITPKKAKNSRMMLLF